MIALPKNNNARGIRLYFREWRECAGLSHEQLAPLIGESTATISKYENDKRIGIRLTYLIKFARAVGCPNPWDPIAGPPGTLPLMYRQLRDLNPAGQDAAQRIIEAIRDLGA